MSWRPHTHWASTGKVPEERFSHAILSSTPIRRWLPVPILSEAQERTSGRRRDRGDGTEENGAPKALL